MDSLSILPMAIAPIPQHTEKEITVFNITATSSTAKDTKQASVERHDSSAPDLGRARLHTKVCRQPFRSAFPPVFNRMAPQKMAEEGEQKILCPVKATKELANATENNYSKSIWGRGTVYSRNTDSWLFKRKETRELSGILPQASLLLSGAAVVLNTGISPSQKSLQCRHCLRVQLETRNLKSLEDLPAKLCVT